MYAVSLRLAAQSVALHCAKRPVSRGAGVHVRVLAAPSHFQVALPESHVQIINNSGAV